MKSWFGKFIPVIVVCAFLFTSFSLFTIFTNVSTLQKSEILIMHIHISQENLDTVYSLLLYVGNLQKNYLLTNQKSFLSSFTNLSQELTSQLVRLETDTNNTTQQKNLALLKKLIPAQIHFLQNEIMLHKQNGSSYADSLPFNDEQKTMNQIKQVVSQMQHEEQTILQMRENQTKQEYITIYTNTALTFFGDILIISIAFYFLRKELQQRSEIEKTKDDFINLASHELNTPITSLKIFSRVLRSKLDVKYLSIHNYLDKIDEQTNKLTMLITDLLDISRIQTGKINISKEHFSLPSLITETIDGIQGTTVLHQITVKQHVEVDIFADRYRIYQVLVNLLTNAIKYSPKGGIIVIATDKRKKETIVSVTDPGIGIDKKYQQKIFDRLYQVTEVREKTFPGLGIGLFISREIIALHGGKMWVTSEKGEGSTFYFTIPN